MSWLISYPWRGRLSSRERIRSSALPFFSSRSKIAFVVAIYSLDIYGLDKVLVKLGDCHATAFRREGAKKLPAGRGVFVSAGLSSCWFGEVPLPLRSRGQPRRL